MARESLTTAGTAVAIVAFALVAAVGTAAAVPIVVAVDAPGTATAGEEVEITYELTNDGDEETSALGLNVTVPDGLEVREIRTDGAAADNRNSVFWIDPVEPDGTVTATFVLAVADDAGGEAVLEAEVASSTATEHEKTSIVLEPADDGGREDGDGNGDGEAGSEDENDDSDGSDDDGDGSDDDGEAENADPDGGDDAGESDDTDESDATDTENADDGTESTGGDDGTTDGGATSDVADSETALPGDVPIVAAGVGALVLLAIGGGLWYRRS